MRALSIRQPWAWCIVTGRKPVENRDWRTSFRGRFLVHAGQKFDIDGLYWLRHEGLIPYDMEPSDFELGGIVGEATITDCVTEMDSPWFFGKYGFVIAGAKPLPFRRVLGKLNFFDVSDGEPNT